MLPWYSFVIPAADMIFLLFIAYDFMVKISFSRWNLVILPFDLSLCRLLSPYVESNLTFTTWQPWWQKNWVSDVYNFNFFVLFLFVCCSGAYHLLKFFLHFVQLPSSLLLGWLYLPLLFKAFSPISIFNIDTLHTKNHLLFLFTRYLYYFLSKQLFLCW